MGGKFWKWFWFVGIWAMFALWGFATYTGLVESVVFVSHVSMLALVLAVLAAWQGARGEQKQDQQIAEQDQEFDEHIGKS